MSSIQRATIVILVIVALAMWGLGLRAALRLGAHADQGRMASSAITEMSAETRAATVSLLTTTPASSPGALSTTSIEVAMPSRSPTATASSSATSAPSLSATHTDQPSPIPSPMATATWHPTITLPSPLVVGPPTNPQTGRFLLVNQDEQMMHVYKDGIEIRTIPISSGRPVANAFTPAWRGNVGRYWGGGPFLNTNLWSDYMWYLFSGGRGSILIHSVPYTWDGDLKVYDQPEALGAIPTSHGCVRISPEDAQWLESWDPVGVPIEITPWSGEIGPPDESL